ncbi:hypothetical protein N389_gp51 [Lactococcus phage jm2]|uniref:Uncharacterized protein n=1 Tax=Lactococcus phage jm2 TaxID=1262535 RepID=R9R1X6_9CAUD|nr:hypothetical protein N389_gp51 [Lactococcus phage jm2]AGI10894.1 hypothetical protein jm2_0051 [Lactococcus phage jm2]
MNISKVIHNLTLEGQDSCLKPRLN